MKKLLLLLPLLWFGYLAGAQEVNCSNGVDDDGDGFIDCFDGNCATNLSCKDFYVGRDKACQTPPTGTANFGMTIGSRSPNRTNWSSGRLVVGDLDNDGVPEVVTVHQSDKKMYILDGKTLAIKYTANTTGDPENYDHTIGNINKDNCAEIFIAERVSSTFFISSYDCTGLLLWRKQVYGEPITMGLADFDGDGKVELYYRNEILDAATGTRLLQGSGSWAAIDAGPVAVDILDNAACATCAGLELVLGGNIYGVDLGARTADAGTLSLAKSIPAASNYYPKNSTFGYVTSLTSIADYTLDGSLDVLTSGINSVTTKTAVFLWDVKNNTYKTFLPSTNWQHGTGRINIGDIDGDGKQNAMFVSGSRLFALKDDFTLFWSIPINEATSGYTSTTVFDFNNDNAVEIVYRDEASLYIIDGKAGTVSTSAVCKSRTANDYPVVVDVDGDGSTEICVSCATNDADVVGNTANTPNGQIRTFKSSLEAWMPSRKVWNQHAYFNVNVNDDLTIPIIQQKHHLVFSAVSCPGGTGPTRPLNTFLNQSPFLDTKGCPTYASADITYDANSVKIIPPTCPDQNFTVSLDIRNVGDLGLSGTLPITFYQGNPMAAGALKLNTVNIELTKFNVGAVVSLTNLAVQGTGNNFTMYVVLNDNGSSVPSPITLPNSTFGECNYTNNIVSASVTPTPFAIQSALISNNIKCGNNATPDNGVAEAFRIVGGVKITAGYNFYWFNGATVGDTATAAFKGAVRSGLAAGTYSIVAFHKGVKCGSTSTQVVVGDQSKNVVAVISEVNPYSDCKNPNGAMKVVLNGGEPSGNFTYQWFEGNVFGTSPTLSTSDQLTNIKALTYSVLVTEKATGCQILESAKVVDKTIQPLVTATSTDAKCNPANSGNASANVGGNTSNYTFAWYIGASVKPAPDYTGATYANISAGNYTVIAAHNTTGCKSEPYTVTVGSSTTIPVAASVTAQQTSCTVPNGSASANVSGSTTGYTFKWFKGNNTLPANLIASAASVTGLAAGVYTVESTNTANGCVDTEVVTVNNVIITPVISSANVTSHLTKCSPFNGEVTVSGTPAGSNTFYWFQGNVGTPDTLASNYKGATYTGINAGYYTVVMVNNFTRCQSARSVVQVLDNTTNPVVTTTSTNQTSCTAASPNGQASANVGGTTTGYKFRWFAGADTSVFLAQSASITNRAAGTYTVKGINTVTRCFELRQVTISNVLVNPALTSTIVNNTNCSGTTPNGSITLQINAGANPVTDFIIQWYEGNGTTVALGTTIGSTTGVNKEKAQGLSGGVYTVRVTDNTTPGEGCYIISTFTITNTPVTITVDNADIALSPQSNCSPVNGSATVNEITVNGAGAGNTTGYTFTWYQSNGTTVIPTSGTAATIGVPLGAGSYYVKATNSATNCSSTLAPFAIIENHVDPVASIITFGDNTQCSGTPSGFITIQIDGGINPVTDYIIDWFEGNGTATPLGTTVGSTSGVNKETAQSLSSGAYTVRIRDNSTPNSGCFSTATFNVNDNFTYPLVSGASTPNTACDPAKSNGSITADVGGTTVGYSFRIFKGQNTLPVNNVTASATGGLAAGVYTVHAISNATGCAATTEVSVQNNITLPTIDNTASTLVNSCTTPDGTASVTAVSVGVLADYTFSWYNGKSVKAAADYTGSTITGLLAGDYTVTATNNVLGCDVQFPVSLAVANAPSTVITINELIGEQVQPAVCNDGQGQLGVQASSPGNAAGFSFTWFQGDKNIGMTAEGNGQNFPVNSNRISNAASSELISSGLHTVIAVDNTTGCFDSLSLNLPYSDEAALLSVLTFPQTDCLAPDGAFRASIQPSAGTAGNPANVGLDQGWYRIDVYQGGTLIKTVPGVNGTPIAVPIVVTGLGAGNYTVLAVETRTPPLPGCSSEPNDVTIGDSRVYPVILANTLNDNKNCTGSTSDTGSITLTVDGTPTPGAGYSYDWHDGKFLSDPSLAAAKVLAPGHSAINIGGGFYTVQVTKASNNCKAEETLYINNTPFIISIPSTDLSITDQTNCSPANGSATVLNVSTDGVSSVGTAGYSFAWFGNDGTTIVPSSTSNAAIGTLISAGNYFVQTTSGASNCSSSLVPFTVDNISVKPVIAISASMDNSNCSGAAANGSITIDVNGAAPAATDFSIQWFTGVGTSSPLPGATTATLSGLAAGSYTVEVIDILAPGNTCSSTATFVLTDDLPIYSISAASITITDQSDCVANGSASVTDVFIDGISNGGVAGFTFQWFDDAGLAIPGAGSASTIAIPLAAGNYRVLAANITSQCSSIVSLFTVDDIAVKPVITASTLTNNTNCTGVLANGSITIDVNGAVPAASDYTMQWFTGLGTGSPIVGATTATISALASDDYTVEVIDILSPGNSCSTISTFFIDNDLPSYLVSAGFISVSDQSDCVPNGTASITDILIDGVSNAGVAGFTFEWLDNAGVVIAGAGNGAIVGVPLAAGDYFVQATNTTSSCSSSLAPFTVDDISVKPLITISANVDNTNCSGVSGNGSMSINVNGAAPLATDFNIQWFSGIGTGSPITGATTATLSGLMSGDYTVEVTDILSPGNTCVNTATFFINDNVPVYSIDVAAISVSDQTDCVANGSATVTDVLTNGISNGGVGGFTFEWLDNAGLTIAGAGNSATTAIPLSAGNYRVRATNTLSNCTSSFMQFIVNDISVKPVITINALMDNTNCVGAPANGSMSININGVSPAAADFSIQWYTGTGTAAPIVGATTASLSALAAGDYTVRVTDLLSPGNTCVNTATFAISNDLPVYTINGPSISITNQTDCVGNGSASVTDVLIDGVSNAGVAGFSFEWLDNSGIIIPGAGNAATIGVVLAAGDYRVQAKATGSQCSSIISSFTIDDISVKPVVAVNTLVDNTNCSGAARNGSLTITVDGAAPAATDFSIQWYTGTGVSTPIVGATTASLSALGAGSYTVEVTDILSPGNTCSTISTFSISDDLPIYTIATASIAVTDQTDCVSNGSAMVTDVFVDGVSNAGVAGFVFEWLDGAATTISGAGSGATIGVPLAAGSYFVRATSNASNCVSSVTAFSVDDNSIKPAITINSLTDNTNCSGASANGSITIDVNGISPAATAFTIQWYSGTDKSSPVSGATTATLSGLATGSYTVEVIDILSPGNTCSNVATFFIGDDLPVYTISAAAVAITHQTDCSPNGSANVSDVVIDGVSNAGVAGFTFEWFDNAGVTISGAGSGATIGTLLASGSYFVQARSTASSCSSSLIPFTVNNVSVLPGITVNALSDNTNCSGASLNGAISINVNGVAPAATDFTIQWYTGIGTGSPIAGATASSLTGLAAGDYTVQVTDALSPSNTCSSVSTMVVNNAPYIIGLNNTLIAITDNSNCVPTNGSARVTGVMFNGVQGNNTADYTFEWLNKDLTPIDPGTGPTVGATLIAGDYLVRVNHTASTCTSALTPFTIKEMAQVPVVVAVKNMDNVACNTSYTGEASASVSEGLSNGITAGYLFEWFTGANNTNAADLIVTNPVMTGQMEGTYTVRVTDTTAPSANCASITTISINRDVPVINGTLTASPQTTCAPIQDGSIVVNTVQTFALGSTTTYNMNVANDRNKFSFQWFNETRAPVSALAPGVNLSPNFTEGIYYSRITDALGCTSDYINAVVEDLTVKPLVAVQEFTNPAVCVLPEAKGSILVTADNNPNFSDYTFEWHEGATDAGPVAEPNNPLLTNVSYTGITTYTVKVTNNATQCVTLETYKFLTDTVAIQVVASAVPLTSCVTDDGSLFAATRTGSGQLYNIEWYIGAGVGTTPDFTGNEVMVAPIATYTVIARHPNLSFCESIPDTVAVTDGRYYPPVMVTQKDALTYCDPSNPNGVAYASVNGKIAGYSFDWYEGSLNGRLIYTGSEAGILKAITYEVKGTDVISGCYGTANITIESNPLVTPIPEVTLLSDYANCIAPDGALSAAVNGVTKDHIFNWYDGTAVKNQPDAVGEMYVDLINGTYAVTATDRVSGCISAVVQQNVTDARVYPEFEVKTFNTNCDDAIGKAEFVALNDVLVATFEWDIAGAIQNGPFATDLPSGNYTVTAVSYNLCETTMSFELKSDITVYNGVSRNNDGSNDIFEIGCIGDYPNNSVRVFNRAGTLVFETKGYNNEDIFFDGISNRGINILGNTLPDGTYFYIISKGDGSEDRTGYLELLH